MEVQLSKKTNKLKKAESKKESLQKIQYSHVQLYDYLFPQEVELFEYLLNQFPEKKHINVLRKGELEYAVRIRIIELLDNIVSEIPRCSTCWLMGNSSFASWVDEIDHAESFVNRLYRKFFDQNYVRLESFVNHFVTIKGYLSELLERDAEARENIDFPENVQSEIFDEEFWRIVDKLDEVIQNTNEEFERKYEFFNPDFLDSEFLSQVIQQSRNHSSQNCERSSPY